MIGLLYKIDPARYFSTLSRTIINWVLIRYSIDAHQKTDAGFSCNPNKNIEPRLKTGRSTGGLAKCQAILIHNPPLTPKENL